MENELENKGQNDVDNSTKLTLIPKGVMETALSAIKIQDTYNMALAPIMNQMKLVNSVNLPLCSSVFRQQEIANAFSNKLKGILFQADSIRFGLFGTSIMPYYNNLASSLAKSVKPVMNKRLFALCDSISSIVSSYQFAPAQEMLRPIQLVLQTIDFSPLYRFLEPLKYFDLVKNRKRLNKIITEEAYNARWFPHALCINDNGKIAQFWRILCSTRKSKNRIKKIDSLVFAFYTKSKIEDMKKKWRKKNIPKHIMRMMHQAVQAYHRKEYAVTTAVMSTLWEGIIYEKANDTRGKKGELTKENLEKLVLQEDYDKIYASFFKEYIMYDCRSVEQVKEDVPGRHSSAHGLHKKYPSKKAGLNAILFTDFLLELEPISQDIPIGA